MGFFSHLGGMRLGTVKEGASANMGVAVVAQSKDVVFGADATVTTAFIIPAGSQINGFDIDVTTAFNAVTTNTLKIGTTSGGAELVPATSCSAAGRLAPTLIAANLTAMKNVGTTDVTVYVTYNQTGTVATAGAATVTARYTVRNADGTTANPA